ncbi:MAG: hypothetical protein HY318_03480 [Armatimonadetes bacterium]|nr:hypothetical protein [Armatimonadota bacterium]
MRVGIDTGGTFTGLVIYGEVNGRFRTFKTPSTPEGHRAQRIPNPSS